MTDTPFDPVHSDLESTTAAPHPEEMRGTIRLEFGDRKSLTLTGRTTPAGLVGVALLALAVLVPIAVVIRKRR